MNDLARRRHTWMVACVLVLSFQFIGCGPKDDGASTRPAGSDTDRERQGLQGTWILSYAEDNGRAETKEELARVRWTFEGDSYTLTYRTDLREGTYKTAPAKDPKEIDLFVTAGVDRGNSYQGIYKLADDEFVVCWPNDTRTGRPKEFTGRAGSGQVLLVFRRKK